MVKRIWSLMALVAVLCVLLTALPLGAMAEESYENTYHNSGDQKKDIVAVAATQIGYIEGSLEGTRAGSYDNYTKYGVWYDSAVAAGDGTYERASWGLMFLAWCANQADIPFDVILKGNTVPYVPYVYNAFEADGAIHASASQGGEYIPQAGDLIFFKSSMTTLPSRVGIVRYAANGYVYTIEGNTSFPSGEPETQGVAKKSYSLQYSNIYAYASPVYETADFANSYSNTGDERADIVAVAKTQIGYTEAADGSTKYGAWYNSVTAEETVSTSWEAVFVAWCAAQAGLSTDIIPCTNYTPYLCNTLESAGRSFASAAQGGDYTPRVGDIAFFKAAALTYPTACGIVSAVDDTYVTVICGNATYGAFEQEVAVDEKVYVLSDSRLYAYASPDYGVNEAKHLITLSDSSYSVKDGVLQGVQAGTTVDELLAVISSNGNVGVYNGGVPAKEGAVATNQYITVYISGCNPQSIRIAVCGDADGDGDVDTTDIRLALKNSLSESFDDVQNKACDLDEDGMVDTVDVRRMLSGMV